MMLALPKQTLEVADRPSISSIARAVPYSAALRSVEQSLEQLRGKREALAIEYRAACAAANSSRLHSGATEVERLRIALKPLEDEIKLKRAEAAQLRRARSMTVAGALKELEMDSARRLLDATEQLQQAYCELRDICEEIRRAGDADQPYFQIPFVGAVGAHAQRIVGRSK